MGISSIYYSAFQIHQNFEMKIWYYIESIKKQLELKYEIVFMTKKIAPNIKYNGWSKLSRNFAKLRFDARSDMNLAYMYVNGNKCQKSALFKIIQQLNLFCLCTLQRDHILLSFFAMIGSITCFVYNWLYTGI